MTILYGPFPVDVAIPPLGTDLVGSAITGVPGLATKGRSLTTEDRQIQNRNSVSTCLRPNPDHKSHRSGIAARPHPGAAHFRTFRSASRV